MNSSIRRCSGNLVQQLRLNAQIKSSLRPQIHLHTSRFFSSNANGASSKIKNILRVPNVDNRSSLERELKPVDFRTVEDPYDGQKGHSIKKAPKVTTPPVKPNFYPTIIGETATEVARKNIFLEDYGDIPSYCLIHDFAEKEDVSKWKIITDAEVGGTTQAKLSWGTATCPVTHLPIRTLVFQGRLGRLLMPEYEKRSNEGGMLNSIRNFATKDDSVVPASEEEVAKFKSARLDNSDNAHPLTSDLSRNDFEEENVNRHFPVASIRYDNLSQMDDTKTNGYVDSNDNTNFSNEDEIDGYEVKAHSLSDVNGFCGLIGPSFEPALATDEWDAYNICIRTDGGPWTVTMRVPSADDTEMYVAGVGPEGGGDPIYPRDTDTASKRMRNLFLPFSEFTGSSAGRMKEVKYSHALGISRFGVSIRGPPGPFRVEIGWVALKNMSDIEIGSPVDSIGTVSDQSIVPCPDISSQGNIQSSFQIWSDEAPLSSSIDLEKEVTSEFDIQLEDSTLKMALKSRLDQIGESKRRIMDLSRLIDTESQHDEYKEMDVKSPYENVEFMKRKELRQRNDRLRGLLRTYGHLSDDDLLAFVSREDIVSLRKLSLNLTPLEEKEVKEDAQWEAKYEKSLKSKTRQNLKPILWSEVRSHGSKFNAIGKWVSGVSRFFGVPISSADKEIELAMAQLRARELAEGDDYIIVMDPPSETDLEMEKHKEMQEQLTLRPFDPSQKITNLERARFDGDEIRPPISALPITPEEEQEAELKGFGPRAQIPKQAEIESMLNPDFVAAVNAQNTFKKRDR